ncbi:MAG: alpha-1,2-fucosyltransferase [Ruthenibacterium sp.]
MAKQISLRSTGNLGNQMFQYAAARRVSLQEGGAPIQIELGGAFHTDWLADFTAPHTLCKKSRRTPLQAVLRSALHWIRYAVLRQDVGKIQKLQRPLQPWLNRLGVYYYSYGYYPFAAAKCDNIILEGYFETAQYADAIRDTLLRDFTPRHAPLAENASLYEKIQSTNAVCVSVRRGDFVTGANSADAADCNVCTADYFQRAIAYCKEHLEQPVFFLFSDDTAWAREHLAADGCEVYCERGTDPVWEKLRLMYSCRHFILSNSTFSWWAQYLSRRHDKLVIAPSRWRNHSVNSEIYEKSWVLLSPDAENPVL